MSKEITITENDQELLVKTLQTSVYQDSTPEGIKLVIDYCRHLQLDPLMKPVHLVTYGKKETIVPGIGLYRIRAHRTGQYVGMTEPEFGPTKTELVGKTKMSYPEWCTVVVKRSINGQIAEFAAKEYFLENVGTLGDKVSPTLFWYKRPFGQLAKVCESQALRKAFPDLVSSQPTFEEVHNNASFVEEGRAEKELNPQQAINNTAKSLKEKFEATPEREITNKESGEVIDLKGKNKEELLELLKNVIKEDEITTGTLDYYKAQANVKSFSKMNLTQLADLIVLFYEEKEINNG